MAGTSVKNRGSLLGPPMSMVTAQVAVIEPLIRFSVDADVGESGEGRTHNRRLRTLLGENKVLFHVAN